MKKLCVFCACLTAALLVSSAWARAQLNPGDTINLSPETRPQQFDPLALFDEMADIVRNRGILSGTWSVTLQSGRIKALGAETREQLLASLNATLSDLGLRGARVLSSNDPEYYYALAMLGSGVQNLDRVSGTSSVQMVDVGFLWRFDLQGAVVTDVFEGSDAQAGGIKAGDTIVGVDGKPFTGLGDFKTKAGRQVIVALNGPDGYRNVSITPNYISPLQQLQNAMAASVRQVTYKNARFGYVHCRVINQAAVQYLRRELSQGTLTGIKGLVLDLRDVFWAEPVDFLGLFSNLLNPKVEIGDRTGLRSLWASAWEGPMAVLIDKGTRGFVEVYAYGIRRDNIGTLMGTRTGGELVQPGGFVLSDGSLLVLPVAEIFVDSSRMTGRAVDPEISVEAGTGAESADPVLEAALELLLTK